MILALLRPIIFIAVVVGFTIFMLKIARNNSKRRSEAINQLIDLAVNKLEDGQAQVSNDSADTINTNITSASLPKITIPNRINLAESVIPDDFILKDEFEILKYMAIKYPDYCNITLYEPASITTISMCEQRMGIKFTDELKALYTFTNGLDISFSILEFDFLESIERMHETGYCDFEKEGDANDYVIVGSSMGCGDPIVMEKSTGNLYVIDHEIGEKSEVYTLKELLYWAIEFRAEDVCDDDIVNQFLEARK